MKVDAFSLGFGPEIAGFVDRKGTRWRLGLLPLGGYVKFHGDANGASMTDEEAVASMPEAEKKVSFFGQSVWKRAAIVVAGPLANFVLAVVIFTGIFAIHGRGVLIPQVEKIAHDSAAEAAGFKPNDVILSIDGRKVDSFEDVQRIVQSSSDTPLTFIVTRQGKDVALVATPRRRSMTQRRAYRMSASLASRPRRSKPIGTSSVTASSNPSSSPPARRGTSSSRRRPMHAD